ncbi:hypothetical protein [Pasteurella sp. PK-2025]|uniref:hypothetical protein n=1 Tax=unclassified Pasteurella TaxID=2621516 RepID=UPI003C746011
MKKIMAVSLALISSMTFAKTQTPVNSEQQQAQQQPPIAVLRVFDTSNKEPKLIEGNALSRSKKRNLCIFISNVEKKEQNLLAEFFKVPAAMKMHAEGAEIQSSPDNKEHLILFNVPKSALQSDVITQCWQFSKSDPIGTYQLEIQFNETVFKGLSFRILK